ncbi:FAD-binding protein [Fusobacterium mortiferum]|uniref:FAD-binding protein n=1 Tax=Fusobacterium mortiferum TaxID=850 RepID=UPI001F27BBF4|nr:FAD-binding protein [Fusobacterium mortiferum]MCF2698884.1 FAD-binding protein [Fusobacterium mortiferum]
MGIDLLKDNIVISHFAHSCNGGLKIDEFARTGVNGLYAIGEVASIIEGANRLGGNSLGGSLVFANRAIINAVEYIKNTKSFKLKKRDVEQDFNAWIREITREDKNNLLDKKSVIKILKNITSDNLGIVRSAEKVKRLFEELKNMRESYSIEKNLKEGSLEVYLMEESIKMLALSILNREESRGAHYREDFPETSNEVVKLNVKRKNNEFIIEKVKVR